MTDYLIIPARHASVRFPGKPLAPLGGRPILQWVWEAACRVPGDNAVLVATDDARIADASRAWGAEVAMTRPECASGSDRCAEALAAAEERAGHHARHVVNIQGDEPFLDPAVVEACLERLNADASVDVSTAVLPIDDERAFSSSHVVKALPDAGGRALLFSRTPIPSSSRATPEETAAAFAGFLSGNAQPAPSRLLGFKHLGLYAFRREALLAFVALPPSRLERLEKLEQLRMLENGIAIGLVPVAHDSVGIDTPEDLERAEAFLRKRRPHA